MRNPFRFGALPVALVALAAAPSLAGAAAAQTGPVHLVRINGKSATVVAGSKSSVGVRIAFTPAAGVTSVNVEISRGGTKRQTKSVPLTVAASGAATAQSHVDVHAAGSYSVAVKAGGATIGKPQTFLAIPSTLGPGAHGARVRALQTKLTQDKYVVGAAGVYDARTARAVEAANKRLGLARTQTLSKSLATRLAAGEGTWTVRFPGHGRHVEADLSLQDLALIDAGGKVERIYPTSSGKPSTPTILGSFHVYRKDIGANSEGMINSSYFIRGYAIHGYYDVPNYNASHGCLRVPIPDSMSIFNWVQYGTTVDVYR
jgi:lipoprotein-anchoring transpeptidase ErfK/SrfK